MCAHPTEPDSHRQFCCAHCRKFVAICSRCDRGQSCCSETCTKARRARLHRQNNCRYQSSARGARGHRLRQDRYRKRRRHRLANLLQDLPIAQKVTDQGSPPAVDSPESVTDRPWLLAPGATDMEFVDDLPSPSCADPNDRAPTVYISPRSPSAGVMCAYCGRLSTLLRPSWKRRSTVCLRC